jgi:hypothetical protein
VRQVANTGAQRSNRNDAPDNAHCEVVIDACSVIARAVNLATALAWPQAALISAFYPQDF